MAAPAVKASQRDFAEDLERIAPEWIVFSPQSRLSLT